MIIWILYRKQPANEILGAFSTLDKAKEAATKYEMLPTDWVSFGCEEWYIPDTPWTIFPMIVDKVFK